MKAILVPTDFSDISANSTAYAIEIAKRTKAKLILFHAYHIPVITSDAMVIAPAIEELEKYAAEKLAKLKDELLKKHGPGLNIECVSACGFAIEEINLFTKSNKVDLIVIGMHGANFVTEKLIGSITTSLIRSSNCSVLAIDNKVTFVEPKKIAFACDYMETDDKTILDSLKEIVSLFKSHVYVLNVIGKKEFVPTIKEAVIDFISLEDSLEGVEHSLHYTHNKNIVEGINEFVLERKMDMIVMIPRKHSVLKNIFQEPNTKRMAFHTHLPLLALHH